jgi:hypothetical protein
MWLEVAAGKVNDMVIFLFYMLERKCLRCVRAFVNSMR